MNTITSRNGRRFVADMYRANDNERRGPMRQRVWAAFLVLVFGIAALLGWWIERYWMILIERDQIAIQSMRIDVPRTLKLCAFAAVCFFATVGLFIWGGSLWWIPFFLCYCMATFVFTRE